MKTRWSSSSPPLWNTASKRTSSHPSSLSQRRSTFTTLTLWTLVLSLFCLVVPSLSHSLPFLYQRAYSRNIRPDPCVTKGKERGVCMFAWDCMKANGTHLGTCIDRFYFGSCCKLDSIKRPIKPIDPGHTTVHPNDIPLDISPVEPIIVKPSPGNKPGFEMTGPTMVDSEVTNINETADGHDISEGMDNSTGNKTSNGELDILPETGTAGEIIKTPTVSETPGVPMDKHPGFGPVGEVTDKPTVSETTGDGISKPTVSGTAGEITDKPIVSGSTVSGPTVSGSTDVSRPTGGMDNSEVGTDRPDMTVTDMTGLGVTESEKTTPGAISIGIQVTEKDQPGVNGTGEEKPIGSNTEIVIDTATGSTESNIKPDDGESVDIEPDVITTESPGFYGEVDNNMIGDGIIMQDTFNEDDDDEILFGSSVEDTTTKTEETTNKPSDDAIDKPSDKPLITDKPQVPSTESDGLSGIKPTGPPSTDSPFDIHIEPQEPFTTFPPIKQPSIQDDDKDGQNIVSTIIPPAEKTDEPNNNKIDNGDGDGVDIELTTFYPPVTDKITVDPTTVEDKTEGIFGIGNTAIDSSITTIKPKPMVTKPNETVTETPSLPEGTTIFPQLPSFPGIHVVPAAINGSDHTKPTDNPVSLPEPTTNIPEPSTDISEPSTDTFTELIIISTTTESEKTSDPITNKPVVTIKPTTKPEEDVTDDPNAWIPIEFPDLTEKPKTTEKPIDFPGLTEKPKTTEKPIETSTENSTDDMVVAATTTIATDVAITANNTADPDILADRLNGSKYSEICGRPVFPTKRIVGGSDASFGEFPWQVSLRQWRSVTFLHKCGAALLNENWAITAAHCVENVQPEQLLLRLGEFDLETAEEPYGFVERKVQIIATHPQFDARTFEYDLALLRFYEPIDFQPNVIPICIPEDDYNFIGDTGYVSGWGRLYEDGPLPSIMQKVPVPVITNPECEAMYKVAGYVEHIPQIFICAGYEAGLKDSCEGDSGGPMVIQRDGVWNLAGVISWGIGCALPNQPGVYTRISAFREWIEKIIVF